MANKTLFKSYHGSQLPKTDTVNEAGGKAYKFEAKHALAQYACTGCLNGTYYASAETQLSDILKLTEKVPAEFIAQTALYARREGYMKDLPALLTAVLAVKAPGLMADIFDRVIDNPKMLRNFVQIVRSGITGRKSLGSLPKRMVLSWLDVRSDEQLFTASIGNDPSLADIIKMVHPKPTTKSREALYGYLLGRDVDANFLPEVVREYESYKKLTNRRNIKTPDVPFQMLTSMKLADHEWKDIARHASWQMTRMNLNTFSRHRVFTDKSMVKMIAKRLSNRQLIRQSRVFPYQLMAAYMNANQDIPRTIRLALQDAMEIALENVPEIPGKIYVFPDISGSMHCSVTGYRQGASSKVRCIDVAALIAAAMLRKNPETVVVPFETDIVDPNRIKINPRDSIMTNAEKLASLPAGGTNCSAPLRYLNRKKAKGDLVIYVSDNESWVDSSARWYGKRSVTPTMQAWAEFKQRNRQAKMICIDIQPYQNTQAQEREDIINVGGFSDQVFKLIAAVAAAKRPDNLKKAHGSTSYWVQQIAAQRI